MRVTDFLFGKMIDRRIAEYQSDLITKHCDEVENIYRTMRGWRHDYHNHIQTLLALCGDEERTREYLLTLNDDLTKVDTVIKTGNVMIDAILNSKLSLIKSKGIEVNARAVVPAELAVSEIDLCTIIGNLLDNALEACLRQPEGEERFIRVFIGILKEQLYISVHNSMSGGAKQIVSNEENVTKNKRNMVTGTKKVTEEYINDERKTRKRYASSKGGADHGLGLMRVDSIVDKYKGFINRQNEEGVFATEVMLPLLTV